MTIYLKNGTRTEAVILPSREERIRAAIAGWDDIAELTLLEGQWWLDDTEPVRIQFAWERRAEKEQVSLDDCICSSELAAHLVSLLIDCREAEPELQPELALSAGASFC